MGVFDFGSLLAHPEIGDPSEFHDIRCLSAKLISYWPPRSIDRGGLAISNIGQKKFLDIASILVL